MVAPLSFGRCAITMTSHTQRRFVSNISGLEAWPLSAADHPSEAGGNETINITDADCWILPLSLSSNRLIFLFENFKGNHHMCQSAACDNTNIFNLTSGKGRQPQAFAEPLTFEVFKNFLLYYSLLHKCTISDMIDEPEYNCTFMDAPNECSSGVMAESRQKNCARD